ncbi:MAG: hypothetical protein KDA84_24805, partial [Planctomycetaceae bacterium]|nr:hypothetical protein [Planctomycetaceae bacterium]
TEERIEKEYHGRETFISKNKDGRIVAKVKAEKDEEPLPGWGKSKGWLEKMFQYSEEDKKEIDSSEIDELTRCLITPQGVETGWVLKSIQGDWNQHPVTRVMSALRSVGYSKDEADCMCGAATFRPWKIVNIPFGPEYPGKRQWNLGAPQLSMRPAAEEGPHPTWDRILNHCGEDLNTYLPNLGWAVESNILTGYDYLLTWIACMIREPFQSLPYLFLFSTEQNTGKSILHESISLLMTNGVVSADRALTNPSDFNGELANAVLCYIEEKDIGKAGATAYNKIKDWTTSPELWIRRMRTDAYKQPNTTHWIQVANNREACPIFPGDTRITVIHVNELEPGHEIPKSKLLALLKEEAPFFLRTLLNLTLPKVYGRLRLPVVDTWHKERSETSNKTSLENFIEERLFESPGEKILFKDFYEKFSEYLDGDEKYHWSKQRVAKSIPEKIMYGVWGANRRHLFNVDWEPPNESEEKTPYKMSNGKVYQDD